MLSYCFSKVKPKHIDDWLQYTVGASRTQTMLFDGTQAKTNTHKWFVLFEHCLLCIDFHPDYFSSTRVEDTLFA